LKICAIVSTSPGTSAGSSDPRLYFNSRGARSTNLTFAIETLLVRETSKLGPADREPQQNQNTDSDSVRGQERIETHMISAE
jgi:hypothetical protein